MSPYALPSDEGQPSMDFAAPCLRWDPLLHGLFVMGFSWCTMELCFVWCATVGSKGSLGFSFHRSRFSMPYLIVAISVRRGAVRGVPLCTTPQIWSAGREAAAVMYVRFQLAAIGFLTLSCGIEAFGLLTLGCLSLIATTWADLFWISQWKLELPRFRFLSPYQVGE